MAEVEKIYILRRNKYMYGPYTLETLQPNTIKQDDLVWYEGIVDWTPAVNMPFLVNFISKNDSNKIKKQGIFKKIFGF